MKTCSGCRQHVFHEETRCPFCATPLLETAAPRVAMALGLAATLTACGPQVEPESTSEGTRTEGSDDSGDGTTAVSTTSTTSITSSTSTTTLDPTGTVDSTGIDSTGSDFLVIPDGGGGVYGSACNLWNNDCPRGEKCMPWANDGGTVWNALRCSPVAELPGQPGDACSVEGSAYSGVDDCDVGLMCFHVDPGTVQGTCVSMCEGSEDSPSCADPSRVCSQTHDGTLILCLQPCDPVAQDCPDGLSCAANDVEFVCVGAGDAGLGQECDPLVGCEPALSCVQEPTPECASRCCAEACDPAMPACTPIGQECEPLGSAGVCTAG